MARLHFIMPVAGLAIGSALMASAPAFAGGGSFGPGTAPPPPPPPSGTYRSHDGDRHPEPSYRNRFSGRSEPREDGRHGDRFGDNRGYRGDYRGRGGYGDPRGRGPGWGGGWAGARPGGVFIGAALFPATPFGFAYGGWAYGRVAGPAQFFSPVAVYRGWGQVAPGRGPSFGYQPYRPAYGGWAAPAHGGDRQPNRVPEYRGWTR